MASVDYFLKIDGIKGESGDSKHKDEIDVLSWSWGETQQGASGQGRTTSRAGFRRHNRACRCRALEGWAPQGRRNPPGLPA